MLTADDIKLLVASGEGYNVEFKISVPSKVKELSEEVCAFANAAGGVLLIGVNDANEIKGDLLDVSKETMETVSVVSEECVRKMAISARKLLKTDYSVAVSGIMGPGGETPEKPVGMVWMAVASENEVRAQVFHFRFDRKRNIELTANSALNMLRLLIVDKS